MNPNIDRLRYLFNQIRTISLWDRIVNWASIKNQLVDAAADLQSIHSFSDHTRDLLISFNTQKKELELAHNQLHRYASQTGADMEKIRNLQEEINQLFQENTRFRHNDEQRRHEHASQMETLSRIRGQIQQDRDKETKEHYEAELNRIKNLKDNWAHHEEHVRSTVRSICSRNHIEWMDKIPFKGEPDNTLKICNEYVIFDAKSPAGEDLRNFPVYLRDQAEKAKKYIREEGVRKEIFLVIPVSALQAVTAHVHKMGDYTVYVISLDALEPLILSLQRLEDYEFAGQLSPEERDNVCRVLGKFAHLTRRRIQIDAFFIRQFMELAYKTENDLPPDILAKAVEFEKAEKLNPPAERRSKQINMKDLEKDTSRLLQETLSKGIPQAGDRLVKQLNELPLYDASS